MPESHIDQPNPGSVSAVTWNGYPAVRVVVHGRVERKDNRRQIFRRADGKPFVAKSKAALDYVKHFMACNMVPARPPMGGKEEVLVVAGNVFYQDRFRGDLAIELVLDCLTKSGIIRDDRFCIRHAVSKCQDKEDPRIDLIVAAIPVDEYDWATGVVRKPDGTTC